MKALILAVALLISSVGSGLAQNSNKVDEAGVQFWTKFKTAVAANDRESVASMTRLPFLLNGKELNKAAFIQKFSVLFDIRVKRCFVKARLVREGDGFEVFCGQQIFLFEKVNDTHKFTEIGAND
jgi:hypothetical protein